MKNKPLKIKLSNGYNLAIAIDDCSFNDCNKEFFVYIEKDHIVTQHIAVIRENVCNNNKIQTFVYADECDEDYTNVFDINILNGEGE